MVLAEERRGKLLEVTVLGLHVPPAETGEEVAGEPDDEPTGNLFDEDPLEDQAPGGIEEVAHEAVRETESDEPDAAAGA